MKAFHNNPRVKEKYLNRVLAHQKADHLIRGVGWNKKSKTGCAVGCTLEAYDHKAYETELGIPQWLARVEDCLFEGMSLEKSKTWPEKFLEAIPLGVDLEKIKGPFLIMVLESTFASFDPIKFPKVKECIERVIHLWKTNGTPKDFRSARRDAATAAAYDTDVTAAYAVYAADAAYAATDAATAPYARANKYDYFADELLKLLRKAK